ncbi:MAG: hypothetical protein WCW64_05320, partial [Phycisphaerae bacterium]
MYNTHKSLSLRSLVFGIVFVLSVFTSAQKSMALPFDPNNYTFLVYDPTPSNHWIRAAMEHILGRQLNQNEIRDSTNPVTATDIASHDILIVGTNGGGDTTGLDAITLSTGITGRVILTGH